MRPLVTRTSRRDRKCFTSRVEASPEGWPRSSAEKSSESSWAFLRESGGGTHGEVAEAEPELRIRAGKAAALTVGEAMVAAGRFAIGFDNRRQESGTVRDGVHCFLGGGYPHMKMHECQNK